MQHFETIIVGAGPAGLQLGYFLQKGGHSYCILERAPIAASFFDHYPHSGKLISINKKHTGSDAYDFNLRHDWNSLLNDEKMSFTTYSDDYYPAKDDLVRYMNDFAGRFKLNIKYRHSVSEVHKQDDGTYRLLIDASGATVQATCVKLVMATGLSMPHRPQFINDTKVMPKHYADYPKDFFKKSDNLKIFNNKSVLILGNGNSAYELGNILTPHASHIAIYGRNQKQWAAVTHYTGDLRSVYMSFFDTFLLKSLNAINWGTEPTGLQQDHFSDKYSFYYICSPTCAKKHKIYSIDGFDHVIFCTGWKFDASPFKFDVPLTRQKKYPVITDSYESSEHKNLFFIGALMHSLDFKKSSGGFIHGFRYLINYFYNIHYDKKIDIDTFPGNDLDQILSHILYKINHTSPMYQLYGYMGDTFFYDTTKSKFIYFNNVPESFSKFFIKKYKDMIFFRLHLEYGNETIEKIQDLGIGTENPAKAQLLRPVLHIGKSRARKPTEVGTESHVVDTLESIYFPEDAFAIFKSPTTIVSKFMRAIKGYM